MTIAHIELQAVNEERNNYRFYFLSISKDLFDFFIVTSTYGRIGTKGNKKYFAYKCIFEAQDKIESIIKKRKGAKKRIGVDYSITSRYDPHGIMVFDDFMNNIKKNNSNATNFD